MNIHYLLFALHKIKLFLFPPICTFCSEPTEEYDSLCSKCWLSVKFINRGVCKYCGEAIDGENPQKYPFNISTGYCQNCFKLGFCKPSNNFMASIAYDDFVKPFIIKMKQHNSPNLALLFAKFFHVSDFEKADLIIPVPIHPLRLYQRTYNQTALLAFALKYWYGNAVPPVAVNILKKSHYTSKQKGKNAAERAANVKDSFFVPPHMQKHIKDKSIVIIDDVLASGATLNECKQVLEKAGAKEVRGIALAQTEFIKNHQNDE